MKETTPIPFHTGDLVSLRTAPGQLYRVISFDMRQWRIRISLSDEDCGKTNRKWIPVKCVKGPAPLYQSYSEGLEGGSEE